MLLSLSIVLLYCIVFLVRCNSIVFRTQQFTYEGYYNRLISNWLVVIDGPLMLAWV